MLFKNIYNLIEMNTTVIIRDRENEVIVTAENKRNYSSRLVDVIEAEGNKIIITLV